jgi:hypothetical protein
LRPYLAGDKILTQGEPTTNFYIVDSGFVNMRYTDRTGYEKPIGSKGPGDFFGVKMFTTQEAAEYTFEAVDRAEMWVVERQDWDILLEKFPNILDHMPELRAEYDKLTRGLDWLAPGEVVDIMTRRHWWALFLMIRLPLFVALLFTAAFLTSVTFQIDQRLPWIIYVYGAALVITFVWAALNATIWLQNIYIITNKRAIRIDRVWFLSDARDELPIERIQSQRVERGGPISVFLNIADLYMTSASSSDAGGLVFQQVSNVERIQRAIDSEKAKVTERRGAAERERLRAQIAGEIRHYIFQQPTPPEKPTPLPAPVPFRTRAFAVWNQMFGTEIRAGRNVTWRKHWLILLQQVGAPLAIFIALGALAIFVSIYGSPVILVENGVYFALGALMFIAFAYVVWQWMDWQVDLYQLTENQIIDIESLPFGLHYSEKKADLSKIQDVNTARPRFINTLFNFGDVSARVAGNAEPFTFDSVARPNQVADEISERLVILKMRETERATREQTRSVVDAIVAYHRLMIAERHQAPAPAPHPASASSPAATASNLPIPIENDSEFPSESELRQVP